MSVLQMTPDQINTLDPTQRQSVMQLVSRPCAMSDCFAGRLTIPSANSSWGCSGKGQTNRKIYKKSEPDFGLITYTATHYTVVQVAT